MGDVLGAIARREGGDLSTSITSDAVPDGGREVGICILSGRRFWLGVAAGGGPISSPRSRRRVARSAASTISGRVPGSTSRP